MKCVATGQMTQVNSEFEILTSSSVAYELWFEEEDGSRIANPVNFAIRFFVFNRTVEWICSIDGDGIMLNCEVQEDGTVLCLIPADQFPAGRLMFEVNTTTAWDGFPNDNMFSQDNVFDTGYVYIDGRGQ